jgi:DNA-binding HxlR family transcriptional regulator
VKLQKATKGADAKLHGRWYADACGTAFALELIGERWSALVVRELMLGGRRFSDIRASLPGISAKVLAERLETLIAAGAVVKRQLTEPVPGQVYELTPWGYAAEPAIQELGRWAAQSTLHDPTLPLSPVSLMLSMRTMIDREAARAFDATIGFEVAGEQFVAELKSGDLPIRRANTSGADAVFHAPAAPVLAGLLYGKVPMEELEAGAGLRIEGDRALAKRYANLFGLPPRIGVPPTGGS